MTQNNENSEAKNRSVLTGNERKLPYKVIPLPAGKKRFSFTWDVLKQKLGKLIYINLMMLVCFMPVFVLFFYRYGAVVSAGAAGPFADYLGVGYPASPETVGVAEKMVLQADIWFYLLAVALSVFTALGIAGGLYCTAKLLRTEEEFRFKDFFLGIKQGYVPALIACAVAFVFLFGCAYLWDYAAYAMAMGESKGLWIALRILGCVVTAVVFLLCFWLAAIGCNYKMNVKGIVANVFRLSFSTFLQSVFCLALGALPVVILFFGGLFNFLVGIWYILLGLSVIALIWSSFTDWTFDIFGDYLKGQISAQEKEEAQKRDGGHVLTEEERMSMLLVGGRSAYLSRAIQPLDKGGQPLVPEDNFTAEDLKAIAAARETLKAEGDEYAAAHAGEEKYVKYNRLFDEREKVLTVDTKKSKKKKFEPKMLNG